MNENYWPKFYDEQAERQPPSQFAEFCLEYIPSGAKILDIGAGDGRDSALLATRGPVFAIEPHTRMPSGLSDVHQYHGSFEGYLMSANVKSYRPDVVYSRWVLHSMDYKTQKMLIDYATSKNALLCLEFRAEGDIPPKGHERRPVNPYDVLEQLVSYCNYQIIYFDVDYGYSKKGDDDPYLARIIAKHKGR